MKQGLVVRPAKEEEGRKLNKRGVACRYHSVEIIEVLLSFRSSAAGNRRQYRHNFNQRVVPTIEEASHG